MTMTMHDYCRLSNHHVILSVNLLVGTTPIMDQWLKLVLDKLTHRSSFQVFHALARDRPTCEMKDNLHVCILLAALTWSTALEASKLGIFPPPTLGHSSFHESREKKAEGNEGEGEGARGRSLQKYTWTVHDDSKIPVTHSHMLDLCESTHFKHLSPHLSRSILMERWGRRRRWWWCWCSCRQWTWKAWNRAMGP